MMDSKGWEWDKADQQPWLKPSEDSYFLADKWKDAGFKDILDLGAGLGRHSILFAKNGFKVSAQDISEYAMDRLKEWAAAESLDIEIKVGDMVDLPYEDGSFDCVFANHVISHTDTLGAKKVISEMERVLKPGGEIFTSICSKETWCYMNGGYPKIDDNTILWTEEGPEKNVQHFFADLDDVLDLFGNFNIEKVRHIDYCYLDSKKQNRKYYYINASKKMPGDLIIKQIEHNSDIYKSELELRDRVLRKPLGMSVYNDLSNEGNDIHVGAFLGGCLIGVLVLTPLSNSDIKMRQVAVTEVHRGKGIGRKLVAYAEELARILGYRKIVLNSRKTAVPFYEKLGYRKTGAEFIEVTIPHFKMFKEL